MPIYVLRGSWGVLENSWGFGSSSFNDGFRILASDGFIREVDEELQRDRLANLWKRYGPIVMGTALFLVLGTAGKVAWDAWQDRQLDQQGAAFAAAEAALSSNDAEGAADKFESLAAAQSGNAAAIAMLREAEARHAAGDTDAALALLDELAASDGIDRILREYAAMAGAQRRVGLFDPASMQAALVPLSATESPFRYSAREMMALAALRAGDEDAAIDALRQLAAEVGTPEDMRRRATEMLAALGVTEADERPAEDSGADAS